MSKIRIPDLTFPSFAYGTTACPHDLRILLYRGGAGTNSKTVSELIERGTLGQPVVQRLPLVRRLHDAVSANLAKGMSQVTVQNRIWALRGFFRWCDENGFDPSIESAEQAYYGWTESLLHRARIVGDLNQRSAYRTAGEVDALLSIVFDARQGFRRLTRLRAPNSPPSALGPKADKQNLEDTFEFGRVLFDICESLPIEAIRGSLPIVLRFRTGRQLEEWIGLQPPGKIKALNGQSDAHNTRVVIRNRAAREADTSLRTRHSVVNLRIDCELLIFIAQTSMNLAQACRLRRGKFRYQSDGEDVLVYRVYKGRRAGEADFRIFREYRSLFDRYVAWLDVLIPLEEDDRLFPYVYPGAIPSNNSVSKFRSIHPRCERLGIKYFGPQSLRKTRINWLLRRSGDPALTAEMAQHSQETLIRVYRQPNHQIAAREITRFHQLTDPAIAPPGPGACIEMRRNPRSITGKPENAPTPDCVNPAGCLFCDFHRDIETMEYVWSLLSYCQLKIIELARFAPPSKNDTAHPAITSVISRISAKLKFFEESSAIRSQWVSEARNRVLEGRYHEAWDGFIQCLEIDA